VAFTAAPILAAATPTEDGALKKKKKDSESDGESSDEEEEEELQLLDWGKLEEEMKGFKVKCFVMFLRVVTTTSLRRALERLCVSFCSRKTASRLLKEPAKSALRKFARTESRRHTAFLMVKTAAYANVLAYSANLIVEEAVLLYYFLKDSAEEHKTTLFVKKASHVVLSHAAAFFFSALGIAVGTAIKPGWGTIIGAASGDLGFILCNQGI